MYGAWQWREEEKVDTILEEACPYFDIIKEYYPHFYFKQAKNGRKPRAHRGRVGIFFFFFLIR